MIRLGLLVVVAVACLPAAAAAQQQPLTIETVLDAVDRAFPLLDAAQREADAADGQNLAARGAFDFTVRATGDVLRGAGYDNEAATIGIRQPLAPAGIDLFGGYRLGRGTFAPYDGKAQTLSDGEWRAGVSLPLLKNRAIDSRRATLARTALGQRLAEQRVDVARLRFRGEAALRYWDWVAAGRQQAVAADLLAIAETRDRDLADAIALGQLAPIERVDNRRAILQRQSGIIAARRQTERQAIALSLYFRRVDGTPAIVGAEALPATLPPPPPPVTRAEIEAAIAEALALRPDVRALRLQREQQEVALELARNALLPSLDLLTQVARDQGEGSRTLRGTEVEVGGAFSLPVARRQARGDEQTALATLARINAELRFANDRVRTEIEDAASALEAAAEAARIVGEELAVARELEQAERDRFLLGDSTQFLVNLRELATADAALREIAAIAEAHKARVAYDVAAASGLPARTMTRTP